MRQRRDPPRPTMPRQSKGGAVQYRPQRIRLYTIRPAPGTPAPDTPAHQLTPVPIARRRLGSYLQLRFTTPPVPHSPEAPAPHSPVPFTQVATFCTGRSPCTPTLLPRPGPDASRRRSPARHADTPPAVRAPGPAPTRTVPTPPPGPRDAGLLPDPYTDGADPQAPPDGGRPADGSQVIAALHSSPSRRWTPTAARPLHGRRTRKVIQGASSATAGSVAI